MSKSKDIGGILLFIGLAPIFIGMILVLCVLGYNLVVKGDWIELISAFSAICIVIGGWMSQGQ